MIIILCITKKLTFSDFSFFNMTGYRALAIILFVFRTFLFAWKTKNTMISISGSIYINEFNEIKRFYISISIAKYSPRIHKIIHSDTFIKKANNSTLPYINGEVLFSEFFFYLIDIKWKYYLDKSLTRDILRINLCPS